MTGKKVPFVKGVRFQTETLTTIEVRLAKFLMDLRTARFGLIPSQHALDQLDDDWEEEKDVLALRDCQKIRRRAKRHQ